MFCRIDEFVFCINHKGISFTRMSFIGDEEFWYSWGDTTYVQSTDN